MPKPKPNKTKRTEQPRAALEAIIVPKKPKRKVTIGNRRESHDVAFLTRFLIVCEGPTEAAYFEGLCRAFDVRANFSVEVLPQENELDGYKGSSVKGLLALATQKNKISKYDETWIVTDNDEGNAYKLDNPSLFKIEKCVSNAIYERLASFQIREMNVRQKERNKGEHLRIRYFLCRADYENFLKAYILEPSEHHFLDVIIENTTKHTDFTDLYKSNHNVAYSCIAFEYWLLLHFEANTTAFYNSREIIQYFDEKNYFDKSFEKGWYLYKNENQLKLKPFFQNAQNAIRNNERLNQKQLDDGKQFYEVNPYSDVFKLVKLLLNNVM
ncbi:MAG: hypothetical protein RLZZ292_4033 [Bacteroidota bacterium]|jgi:hypothetical protein